MGVRPIHPTVYEINTRAWLREKSRQAGHTLSLRDISDAELDQFVRLGIDYVWLMGVWTTGDRGLYLARTLPNLQRDYQKIVPDYRPDMIDSSPYAITDYRVAERLGGDAGLAHFRSRLQGRNIRLLLDFVPNHLATDHPWTKSHPELFLHGPFGPLEDYYYEVETQHGRQLLAHGRDPNFPPWTDTVQLNYRHPELRETLIEALKRIATQCDGVRCDMAMLVLEDIFDQTWSSDHWKHQGVEEARGEFWTQTIRQIKADFPEFLFVAEAYWDLEWQLQQLGFDFTYDKTFYDRIVRESGATVRAHLSGEASYHNHSARFLENHDEPRAAAILPLPRHRAAAALLATLPGLRLFHEGQLDGRHTKLPVQMVDRPDEPIHLELQQFYERLLSTLNRPIFRFGSWRKLDVVPLASNMDVTQVIAGQWNFGDEPPLISVVNLGTAAVQIRVPYSPHLRLIELFSDRPLQFAPGSAGSLELPLSLGPYDFGVFVP